MSSQIRAGMDLAGLCLQVVPRDEAKHRPLTEYQKSTLFGMGSFGEPLYAQDILRLQPVTSSDGDYVETYKYVITNMPPTLAFLPMNSVFDYLGFVPANTPDLRFVQITVGSNFADRKRMMLMEGPPTRMPRRGDPNFGYGSCSGDGTVMARHFAMENDSIFTRQTGTLPMPSYDRPSICGTGDQAPSLRNLARPFQNAAGGADGAAPAAGGGGDAAAAGAGGVAAAGGADAAAAGGVAAARGEGPDRIVRGVNGLRQQVLPALAGERAAMIAAEALVEFRRRQQLDRNIARAARVDNRRDVPNEANAQNAENQDENAENRGDRPAPPAPPVAPAEVAEVRTAIYRPYLQASSDPRMWLRNETTHVTRLARLFVDWPEMVAFSRDLCRMLKSGVVVNNRIRYLENPDDVDIPMGLNGAYWYRILRAQYDLPDNIDELSNANVANRATLLLRILIITHGIPRSAPVDELILDEILAVINDFLDTVAMIGTGQPGPAMNPLLNLPLVEGQPEIDAIPEEDEEVQAEVPPQ
jgi:hypothetical protein